MPASIRMPTVSRAVSGRSATRSVMVIEAAEAGAARTTKSAANKQAIESFPSAPGGGGARGGGGVKLVVMLLGLCHPPYPDLLRPEGRRRKTRSRIFPR